MINTMYLLVSGKVNYKNIKSLLKQECQHESTQINTNQHESSKSQHESMQVLHELTRINPNQHKCDASQHGSVRPRNSHSLL